MRKMVGRAASRAKYSSLSFLPTRSVAVLPLASDTVNDTAGDARPYVGRFPGVSLTIVTILALATAEKSELIASPSAGALLGFVNFQRSWSFVAASSPDEFLRLNEFASADSK